MICLGNLKGVFSQENTTDGHTETHKSSFCPYKQVSGRNGDHEWLRMTNAFILYDLVWKVQKGHEANREGSFKCEDIRFVPLGLPCFSRFSLEDFFFSYNNAAIAGAARVLVH